jgi:hypothetical protein
MEPHFVGFKFLYSIILVHSVHLFQISSSLVVYLTTISHLQIGYDISPDAIIVLNELGID